MKHPMQPIIMADDKVIRFRENKIVRYLLDQGGIDLNQIGYLAHEGLFDVDDQMQFAQLIGYSVSGFGDLSYASDEIVEAADEIAEKVLAESK